MNQLLRLGFDTREGSLIASTAVVLPPGEPGTRQNALGFGLHTD